MKIFLGNVRFVAPMLQVMNSLSNHEIYRKTCTITDTINDIIVLFAGQNRNLSTIFVHSHVYIALLTTHHFNGKHFICFYM